MKNAILKAAVLATMLAAAVLMSSVLGGCGERIDIPVAIGDFGIFSYLYDDVYEPGYEVREIKFSGAGLHILGADRIERLNIKFAPLDSVTGLVDARSFCVDVDPALFVLFVWEEGLGQVSWYNATSLELLGAADLPGVSTVAAMATNDAGIGQVPWAATFLYLADPVQGVVHRYAFGLANGLESYGILTRSNGDAARFVHEPAGMVSDIQNRLLVCDRDLERNWVIRFDATPDVTDVTPDPNDEDPLRGLAVEFEVSGCLPAPAGDFVLGAATECQEPTPWQPGVSSAPGEFHAPGFVAVDGSGRVFVTDTGNDRIQVFSQTGVFERELGSTDQTPNPLSIGVIDQIVPGRTHYAAYVYVHLGGGNQIVRYVSSEHNRYLNEDDSVEVP